MHNKFAIIDKLILVTGSFNWTASAVYGNQENCLSNLIKFTYLKLFTMNH